MSRSTKKPYITEQQSSKRASLSKRMANRVVRHKNKKACQENEKENLSNGKAYRKATNSWDIRDWSFHEPNNKKAYRK